MSANRQPVADTWAFCGKREENRNEQWFRQAMAQRLSGRHENDFLILAAELIFHLKDTFF